MGSDTTIFEGPDGPCFVDSAVLFLDLLGTAGPHGEQDALTRLRCTKNAVTEARAASPGNTDSSLWRMSWFSDNLCLHYAAAPPVVDTQALGFLVTDASYLQLGMFSHGFVARGAIAYDGFYSDLEFIHGPALDRAVLLEKTRARYPRIVLDESSIAIAVHGLIREEGGSLSSPWRSQLLVDDDGVVFVDYLSTLTD